MLKSIRIAFALLGLLVAVVFGVVGILLTCTLVLAIIGFPLVVGSAGLALASLHLAGWADAERYVAARRDALRARTRRSEPVLSK